VPDAGCHDAPAADPGASGKFRESLRKNRASDPHQRLARRDGDAVPVLTEKLRAL
jgi:hypothetical protein